MAMLVTMPACILVVLALLIDGALCKNSSHFVQEEMCNLKKSIDRGCSNVLDGPRNMVGCSRLCWSDTECVGASLDVQGRCLHHQLCHTSVQCPGPDAMSKTHRYMARYCVHGTWNSSTETCVCRYGTFGDRCNKYQTYCTFLVDSGYAAGSYSVILDPLEDGVNLIKVFCFIQAPHVSIGVLVNSGQIDFNRTWRDYVNGFGEDNLGFWTGLRAAHVLVNAGINYLVADVVFTTGIVQSGYVFMINGEKQGYPIWVKFDQSISHGSPPEGSYAGDCLSSVQGVPFSTWDRDQGGSLGGENCASLAGSGWWYETGCDNPCNMLGWGLDNYDAKPPAQRLTFSGVDVAEHLSQILHIRLYLVK